MECRFFCTLGAGHTGEMGETAGYAGGTDLRRIFFSALVGEVVAR